ncbi:MAG: hypothetical protein KF726_26975 [Anaerolineae bacterium]|nr:hypothetical protein [Anaerolineae bacterium]
MPVTPNTDAYAILGYAVVIIILAALVAYLAWKQRKLTSERAELEQLERESKQK